MFTARKATPMDLFRSTGLAWFVQKSRQSVGSSDHLGVDKMEVALFGPQLNSDNNLIWIHLFMNSG